MTRLRNIDFKNLAWDVAAATLLLYLPLFIFLKYNAYPLAHAEVLLCLALVGLAGLFWGAVMSLGRSPGRFVVMVFLAVLIVDIQTNWITTLGLRLLLNIIFFSLLFWFPRRRLSRFVVLLAGLMVVGTILSPPREQVRIAGPSLDEPVEREDLPFILHIILDEHIGIEGIPRQFDPDRGIASAVRDGFLDRGFRVFGRAYSNYNITRQTIPNLLNFTVSRNMDKYVPVPDGQPVHLRQNAWFDRLGGLGYRIHVFQPEYITFDRRPDRGDGPDLDSSLTFANESIHGLASAELTVSDKSRYIIGSYLRLSYFLTMMRGWYGELRRTAVGHVLGLPDWDQSGKYLSTLSSMNAVKLLEQDLEHAGPGRAFFVHILLPHFPYAFDRECGLRTIDEGWLTSHDKSKYPNDNDAESRALRYPYYLDQMICVDNTFFEILDHLAGKAWWDDSIILIHGDHGSRIGTSQISAPFVDDMTDQDFVDAFSTLFVIKKPGLPAEYDHRQLPLGHLFEQILRLGTDPGDSLLEENPWVLVPDGTNPMLKLSMPHFDNGVVPSG